MSQDNNIQDFCISVHIVPDRGGVYLILQGSVEGKTRDETNQKVTTFLVRQKLYLSRNWPCIYTCSYTEENTLELWKKTISQDQRML